MQLGARDRANLVRCALLAAAVMWCGLPLAAHADTPQAASCPADTTESDDIRETYDAAGHLTHQLRLLKSRVVAEVSVTYDAAGHPTVRTEVAIGHTYIVRTTWRGDDIVESACEADGVVASRVAYDYAGRKVLAKHESTSGVATSTTEYHYDASGQLVLTETRAGSGELTARTASTHAPRSTPIYITATAGGGYQSDTRLIDASGGLGFHRKPAAEHYRSDPLEVALDGALRINRANGVTATDQTTVRLGIDYNLVLPRTTLFTFIATERNLPANLKVNLEEAFLGIKVDLIPRTDWVLDLSFAPVWNFRSIRSPAPAVVPGAPATIDEVTSTLRGSFRLRAMYRPAHYALSETFEFLPYLFGDINVPEPGVWDRAIFRSTTAVQVDFSPTVAFRQEVKYTRDLSMRAQATCPDSNNPLCLGYAVATITSLTLKLEL